MGIKTLKPRLSEQRPRVERRPNNESLRLTGRAGVEARRGWLSHSPLCVHCEATGRVTAGQEVDHVIPLWDGGSDDDSNKQTLCCYHHAIKTAAEAARRYAER